MPERRLLPPLSGLRAFEAAGRHLSLKVAAEEMHVTPSAVSHAVSSLESFLETKLFHRRTRRLLLTDAGAAYLSTVSQAFDSLSVATREAAASRADVLTVASAPTFAKVWLIPRLKLFIRHQADIDLRIHARIEAAARRPGRAGGHPFDALLSGDVDAAIVYGPGGWQGLTIDKLIDEDVVPLCSPALRDGSPALRTPADLIRHTLIHTETKVVTWSIWLEAAGVQSRTGRRSLIFNRAELALNAAVAGLGVALDNRINARPHLASGALVIPFDPKIALEQLGAYFFVCLPGREALPKVKQFREWVIEEARKPFEPSGSPSGRPRNKTVKHRRR
jgi:LysR family transcriptional regulator, glycine cleavage system transcriptional activator